jgi:hypothetical protein
MEYIKPDSATAIYFNDATDMIDQRFGDGYAKKHPELIGALMQTAALDFMAVIIRDTIGEAVEAIANKVRESSEP